MTRRAKPWYIVAIDGVRAERLEGRYATSEEALSRVPRDRKARRTALDDDRAARFRVVHEKTLEIVDP